LIYNYKVTKNWSLDQFLYHLFYWKSGKWMRKSPFPIQTSTAIK